MPPGRAGSLYGELARFILRLLGYKQQPPALQQKAMPGEGSTLYAPQHACMSLLTLAALVPLTPDLSKPGTSASSSSSSHTGS